MAYKKQLLFLYGCLLLLISAGHSQSTEFYIESSLKNYKVQAKAHEDKQMIELKKLIPNLVYDLKYATKNNFMHRRMYPPTTYITFLRKPAVEALYKVQQELNSKGLGIKIFDAYRPYAVTKKFWELVKDERYVAHPAKGSNHNRGTAVDLTIIDLTTGQELNMGTGFDNFTDTAHHSFMNLPMQVIENRKLLTSVMEKYGFTPLSTEWWHYTYRSNIKFEILDIPFKKLLRF